METENKYVLITGASAGLGMAAAKKLAEEGFKVFAGVRKEEDKNALEALNKNITGVILDVTNQESVDKAFEFICSVTDNLYALVNNAGIAVAGAVEFIPVDALRRQFEVNVFGAIRVTQKFLPLINKGRIVNISSMASFGIFPFVSAYSASKRSLDIFFNTLLLECKKPDLKIISIKPGVVKTNIWSKSINAAQKLLEDVPKECLEKYKKEYEFMVKNAEKNAQKGLEAQDIADLIYKVLTLKNPKLSYCIGNDSKIAGLFSKLPMNFVNFVIKKVMKKRFGS